MRMLQLDDAPTSPLPLLPSRRPGSLSRRPLPPRPRSSSPDEGSARLSAPAITRALETPLLRGLLPLAVGCAANVSRVVQAPVMHRGEAILLYCNEGDGWCEMADQRYWMGSGHLAVVAAPATLTYGAAHGRKWTYAWVQASGTNLEYFLEQLGATPQKPLLRIGEDGRLLDLFREMLEVLRAQCTPARLLYAAQTLAHLLSAFIFRQREECAGEMDAAGNIEHSIDYMRQHLGQPLRAATLAAIANMSLPHYFALFKRQVGSTPIDYFIKLRMRHAGQLLAETSWSVKEVAGALGYDDPLYFSRVFKAVHHSTPTDFRARRQSA